jgi:8-oxo-dGTP pyrophosphatase MutT (NUDIX family)
MAKAKIKTKTKAKKAKKKARKKAAKRPVAPRAVSRMPRHRQYGALALRVGSRDQLEVLLVTSRGTGRWVIPKGWPMRNRTPAGTARREAFEEAGVKGELWSKRPIGSFRYVKRDEDFAGEILVQVFVLGVEQQKKEWPEKDERRVRWFSLRQAAALVKERELAKLLRDIPKLLFGPKAVRARRKK